MSATSRIFLLFLVFLAVLGSAFVLPNIAVGSDTGLAAGATAGITFLAIILLAFILAMVLLIVTIRNRSLVSIGVKLVGFLPFPLLIFSVFVVVLLIQQSKEEQRQDEPSPKQIVPVAVPAK